MWLDSFHFVKPLLTSSGTIASISTTNRTGVVRLEPDFLDEPGVFNKIQLTNICKTRNELNRFRYKAYTIPQKFRLDVDFGDSVFFKDVDLVSESDNGANTIKGVAKQIIQEVSKSPSGPTGYNTTFKIIKRFTV